MLKKRTDGQFDLKNSILSLTDKNQYNVIILVEKADQSTTEVDPLVAVLLPITILVGILAIISIISKYLTILSCYLYGCLACSYLLAVLLSITILVGILAIISIISKYLFIFSVFLAIFLDV